MRTSDSAIDYVSKLPFVSHVTVISVERNNKKRGLEPLFS